jgi:hypothetical protein
LRAGVLLAALFWTILQAVGGAYIGHVESKVPSSYATFGVTLALLVWLHLGAQMTMYAAELNTVLQRHLYPRNLLGPPEHPADQATLTALAKAEERNDIEHVDVTFTDPEPDRASEADSDPESDSDRVSASSPAADPDHPDSVAPPAGQEAEAPS